MKKRTRTVRVSSFCNNIVAWMEENTQVVFYPDSQIAKDLELKSRERIRITIEKFEGKQ